MTDTGDPATDFNVGEEVLYGGERFVIAGRSEGGVFRYRLLATRPEGAEVVWALGGDLVRLPAYTRIPDDTADY